MALILGGFELVLKNNELCLDSNYPYNGCVGDHFIISPSSKDKYDLNDDGIEGIRINKRSIIGFAWVHLGKIKRQINISDNNIIRFNDIRYIQPKELLNITNKLKNDYFRYIMWEFTMKYFEKDKHYLSENFYNKYMKDILEYAIKNQNVYIKRIR